MGASNYIFWAQKMETEKRDQEKTVTNRDKNQIFCTSRPFVDALPNKSNE